MAAALERAREIDPDAEVHLDAQAHLEQWYGAMGFETVGGVFLEAGIEHVAMVRRPARA
jgi:ElaA protein